MEDSEYSRSFPESFLLSMGVVYSYGQTAKFIDQSGHTCIVPYNEVILEELKKCGYVFCGYGKATPECESYSEAEEYREKATLPEDLARKVARVEGTQLEPSNGRPYDVFSPDLYTGHQFSHYKCEKILKTLGFESPVSRRFMAVVGYGGQSLSHLPQSIDTLEEFVVYASMHPVLSNNYFSETGLYNYFCPESSTKTSNMY